MPFLRGNQLQQQAEIGDRDWAGQNATLHSLAVKPRRRTWALWPVRDWSADSQPGQAWLLAGHRRKRARTVCATKHPDAFRQENQSFLRWRGGSFWLWGLDAQPLGHERRRWLGPRANPRGLLKMASTLTYGWRWDRYHRKAVYGAYSTLNGYAIWSVQLRRLTIGWDIHARWESPLQTRFIDCYGISAWRVSSWTNF